MVAGSAVDLLDDVQEARHEAVRALASAQADCRTARVRRRREAKTRSKTHVKRHVPDFLEAKHSIRARWRARVGAQCGSVDVKKKELETFEAVRAQLRRRDVDRQRPFAPTP